MRYRVYGLDAMTLAPREPVVIEAATEEAARQQAIATGMAVAAVRPADAITGLPPPTRAADPRLTPLGQQLAAWLEEITPWWVWLCLTVGQVVSVIGGVACAANTIVTIALAATSRVKLLGLAEAVDLTWLLILVGSAAGICWNGALYIVFTRAKRQGRA